MAKLALLLILGCFQFSWQEELTETEKHNNDQINDGIIPSEKNTASTELLDGADEEQWSKTKYKEFSDDWTGDENWPEKTLNLSEEESKDYSDDSEEFDIIKEIGKWFEDDEDDDSNDDDNDDDDWDYFKKEDMDVLLDQNNALNLYYTWLYGIKLRNSDNRLPPFKRFSSV